VIDNQQEHDEYAKPALQSSKQDINASTGQAPRPAAIT
jgi:hypothetical protein